MDRARVPRETSRINAYATGTTTATIDWTAGGWPTVRILYKLRSQPESSYQPLSDYLPKGQVALTGLTPGERYDVLAATRDGREFRHRLLVPKTLGVDLHSVTCDPDGTIYATGVWAAGDAQRIGKTPDGGQTWQGLYVTGNTTYQHWHDGQLYATINWAFGGSGERLYRRLVARPAAGGGSAQRVIEFWLDESISPQWAGVYPWAFEPRGPRFIVGVTGSQGHTSENRAQNRLYYTEDGGSTWFMRPWIPGRDLFRSTDKGDSWTQINEDTSGRFLATRVSIICWNPVSSTYLVAISDNVRRTYLISADLNDWQLVSSSAFSPTQPTGGGAGSVDLPDGGFLTGSIVTRFGHIMRVSSNGTVERVFNWPEWYGAEVFGLEAFDNGEVWACANTSANEERFSEVVYSPDWGRTWNVAYRVPRSQFRMANIARCYSTGRMHGSWVAICRQHGSTNPLLLFPRAT